MSTAQCWDLTVSHGLMPKHSICIIPGGFGGNSLQIQVSAGCLEQEFARTGSLGFVDGMVNFGNSTDSRRK